MSTLGTNNTVNLFHGDKWRAVLSNIPSLTSMRDMDLYNLYVKSVELPEYTLEFIPSQFKGSTIWNPISQDNDNLPDFTIEFKLSENLENWFNLYTWLQSIRYAQPDNSNSQSTALKKNTVKTISILLLDNEKRPKKKMVFKECMLSALGNLPLVMGSSEELTFTTVWKYEEVFLEDV